MNQDETTVALILTYNRRELLFRCLRAVYAQTRQPWRVLVVDNASSDGTQEALVEEVSRLEGRLLVYRSAENLGGAGGFALGAQLALKAGASYVWMMDDDGAPAPNCLERLCAAMAETRAPYVAPNLVDESGASHFQSLIDTAKTDLIGHRGGPFNGVLINKSVFLSIGVPIAKYFFWGDEFEFTNRIRDAGFPMILASKALHVHRRTSFPFGACPRPYHLTRNMLFNARLSTGMYVSRRVLALQAAQVAARLLWGGVLAVNVGQIRAVIKGIHDGLRMPIENDLHSARVAIEGEPSAGFWVGGSGSG